MITNKNIDLEYPINTDININDLLFKQIDYTYQKIDNVVIRNVNDEFVKASGDESNSFNYVVDDFTKDKEVEIDDDIYDKFDELLLSITDYSSATGGDDNIDTLLENINFKINTIQEQTQDLIQNINITQSFYPLQKGDKIYSFTKNERDVVEKVNTFLAKYKEYSQYF
jgi:phosphomevalonate kinase